MKHVITLLLLCTLFVCVFTERSVPCFRLCVVKALEEEDSTKKLRDCARSCMGTSFGRDDVASMLKRMNRIKKVLKEDIQQTVAKLPLEAQSVQPSQEETDNAPEQVESDSQNPTNGATLVTTTTVNVRGGPCTNHGIITTLNPGTTMTYTGQVRSGCSFTWYSIRGSFGSGWIASNFVRVGDSGGSCGNTCPSCVFSRRSDILPFFRNNGWNTECQNYQNILNTWCNMDSTGCNTAKSQCGSICGQNPPPPSPPSPSPSPSPSPGPSPSSSNKFGIGLVTAGSPNEINLTSEMVGNNGWILLIFAGVNRGTQGPEGSWVEAVRNSYQKQLNVVIRIGPHWGSMNIRDEADNAQKTSYKSLAQAYKRVIQGIVHLIPSNRNLYIQVHNEPNLCYEWWCKVPQGRPMPYQQTAREYAFYLNDVIDAVRSIGNSRVKLSLGAMAPGGTRQCGCCGRDNCGAEDQPGVTGLDFLNAMRDAIPNIFQKLDFFASHPYPASNIGWGFNVPFPQAIPGLKYYERELQTIGRPNLPVLITETGWASRREGFPRCSEEEKAEWTRRAWTDVWIPDSRVIGVMPFMLVDGYWGDQLGYGFARTDGGRFPVFDAIRNERSRRGL